MASLLASASFWYFCDISFQLFKLLCLAKNHWWRFCNQNARMVHIVNEIRFKMVYTSWSLFIFQPLHSLGECHCWWIRESMRAHAAKFYGRLRLIGSGSRASTVFPCWIYWNCNFWGLFPIPFGLSLFWHFCYISFQLFSYFVWLRITNDGSVFEMRIWSILFSLFSYCKSPAFTFNTLWGFCIYPKHIFRFSKRGRGFNFIYIFKFVLSLCNQISTSTFDLRFALLVPPQSENASYAPANGKELWVKKTLCLSKVYSICHNWCVWLFNA